MDTDFLVFSLLLIISFFFLVFCEVIPSDLFLVDEGNSRVSVGTTTGVAGFAFNVAGNTTLVGDVLTGTAMKWVNSTNRLGIGTTSPDAPLHVKITDNNDPTKFKWEKIKNSYEFERQRSSKKVQVERR